MKKVNRFLVALALGLFFVGSGGARAPPRHLACLGKSRDHHLDAQDQWSDGERFHFGSQNRPALQTLNSTLRVNPPYGHPALLLFWPMLEARRAGCRLAPRKASRRIRLLLN